MEDSTGYGDRPCCLFSTIFYMFGAVLLILVVLYQFQTRFRFHVKMFLYMLVFVVGGVTGFLISVPFGRTPANHFRIFKIFQIMSSFLCLDIVVRKKEYMESDKPYVLIANHQSFFDVLGMMSCWPSNCVVVLKSSLKYLPGFNLCAYICNSIYINRFSKEKAHQTVDDIVKEVMDEKRKVWIYPEGTRNPDKPLLSFKKGAFIIAKQAKIPIVCCVFSSHKQFYSNAEGRLNDSGFVLAEFLPPVDSTKFETTDELSEHCRKIMQEASDRLDAEVEQKFSIKL